MKIYPYLCACLIALLTIACGTNANPAGPSPLQGSGSGRDSLNATAAGVSCPSSAPVRLLVNTQTVSAILQWEAVPFASGYDVAIERFTTADQTWRAFTVQNTAGPVTTYVFGPLEGLFRVRVRAHICGRNGAYSDPVVFDTDDPDGNTY